MIGIKDDSAMLSFLDSQFPSIESLELVDELLETKKALQKSKEEEKRAAINKLEILQQEFAKRKEEAVSGISAVKSTLDELNLARASKTSSLSADSEISSFVQTLKSDIKQLQILQTTSDVLAILENINRLEKEVISALESNLTKSVSAFEQLSILLSEIAKKDTSLKHSAEVNSINHGTSSKTFDFSGNLKPANTRILCYARNKVKLTWVEMIKHITNSQQSIIKTHWLSDDNANKYPVNRAEMVQLLKSSVLLKTTFNMLDPETKELLSDWDTSGLSKKWNAELSIAALLETTFKKFNYHFSGTLSTNRPDKPEWWLGFLLKDSSKVITYIENDVQKTLWRSNPNGKNASDQYLSGIVKIIRDKLSFESSVWVANPELIPHLLDELAKFDTTVQDLYLYGFTQGSRSTWVGTAEMWMDSNKGVLEAWRNMEYEDARAKYLKLRKEPYAFENNIKGPNGEVEMLFASPLSVRMGSIIESLTGKISKLRKISWKYIFISTIIFPLINSYIEHLESEIDNFKRVSVAFLQSISNFTLNSTSAQSYSSDSTKDPDPKVLFVIEALGLKPLILRLATISGFVYSANNFKELLSEFSDVELWVEVWAWCCKIKSRAISKKEYNSAGSFGGSNDIENATLSSNQLQLYDIDDIEQLNPSDVEYLESGFISEIENVLKKADLSSLSRTKHTQLEKSIFDGYTSTFDGLISSSLDLFKMIFNKEVLALFKQYENAPYLHKQTKSSELENRFELEEGCPDNTLSSSNHQGPVEVSDFIIPILRAVSAILNYTIKNLVTPAHFMVVTKDFMKELDSWVVSNILMQSRWSIENAIQLATDLNAITDCFKASFSAHRPYLGYFGKNVAILPQATEAVYLAALPLKLDIHADPENWSEFANFPKYHPPAEIAKAVISMFYCAQSEYGLDASPLLNQPSRLSFISGSLLTPVYKIKPFSKDDSSAVAMRLKSLGITSLSPARAGIVLQNRIDSALFFKP